MKIEKENAIECYKVFNNNWTCRDFQYEVGKEYHMEGVISPCERGFHACKKLPDCFNGNGYLFNPEETKVAKVKVWGTIIEKATKLCVSDIEIISELTWNEVLDLCNSGNGNSGDLNSGNRNSGDWNSGDRNSGYWNSGNWNSGDRNPGKSNSGNGNSGNCNSGSCNTGNWNSGDRNSGDSNSGCWNSGNRNSSNGNSGNSNTGDSNSGCWNSGNSNTGSWNSGSWNSGNWNSGNWNSGDSNSGYFNTLDQNQIFCFNKPTAKQNISFPAFLYFSLTEWVYVSTMTDEEKDAHPECAAIGGYLKVKEYKEAFRESFLKAKKRSDWQEQLAKLKAIPNFDANIFYEISGIKPEELV